VIYHPATRKQLTFLPISKALLVFIDCFGIFGGFLLPFRLVQRSNFNMPVDTQLLKELHERGLIAQMTGDEQLFEHLCESRALYCGFDPTADSLHIGSLVPLLTLRRFQLAGHTPIALVGGATGLIGDPSFKAQERKLNTSDTVAGWVEKLRAQVSCFVDFDVAANPALVVNNLDWVGQMGVLDFLRRVGKHFSVNNMINKESVKQRLAREGAGISFTEFTYMLLQSYDFAELYQRYNCTLQIGGSDQWGNITGGTDLTRRLHGGQVFGLTLPLVTKADGTKFGKTESGTIWLDAAKTSPYAFYQFWLNSADADVYKFLRYFTFLSVADITQIDAADKAATGRPQAQRILAEEVTRIVHGEAGLDAARRITEALFSGSVEALSQEDFLQLKLDGIPHTTLTRDTLSGMTLTQCLVDGGMASSGKQIKDALGRGAVLINGRAASAEDNMDLHSCFALDRAIYTHFYMVKLGKKTYHLFEIV
jgi:tyrosyl-tRNA synthetase